MAEKFKKFLLVAFLTVFIWSWAYMAQEEQVTEASSLRIAPRTPEKLLVTFDNGTTSIGLDITFQGPAAKIAELQRDLHGVGMEIGHETLEFFYNVENQGQATPGNYDISLLPFLRESSKIRGRGLSVVAVSPETVRVRVEELVEKWLTVLVLDESNQSIPHDTIEPPQVKMFVPSDWTGDLLRANVELTPPQIERARSAPVKVKPYVKLSPLLEKRRFADIAVEVRLPSLVEALDDHVLQPRIGFNISRNIQGSYRVELVNENELTSATNFKATPQAFDAYDKHTRYHVIVEVRDGDENIQGEITRQVRYNFPEEYLRRNEIMLAGPPRTAVFKLVPLEPAPPAVNP